MSALKLAPSKPQAALAELTLDEQAQAVWDIWAQAQAIRRDARDLRLKQAGDPEDVALRTRIDDGLALVERLEGNMRRLEKGIQQQWHWDESSADAPPPPKLTQQAAMLENCKKQLVKATLLLRGRQLAAEASATLREAMDLHRPPADGQKPLSPLEAESRAATLGALIQQRIDDGLKKSRALEIEWQKTAGNAKDESPDNAALYEQVRREQKALKDHKTQLIKAALTLALPAIDAKAPKTLSGEARQKSLAKTIGIMVDELRDIDDRFAAAKDAAEETAKKVKKSDWEVPYSLQQLLDVMCNHARIREYAEAPDFESQQRAVTGLGAIIGVVSESIGTGRDGAALNTLVGLNNDLDKSIVAVRVGCMKQLAAQRFADGLAAHWKSASSHYEHFAQQECDLALARVQLQRALQQAGMVRKMGAIDAMNLNPALVQDFRQGLREKALNHIPSLLRKLMPTSWRRKLESRAERRFDFLLVKLFVQERKVKLSPGHAHVVADLESALEAHEKTVADAGEAFCLQEKNDIRYLEQRWVALKETDSDRLTFELNQLEVKAERLKDVPEGIEAGRDALEMSSRLKKIAEWEASRAPNSSNPEYDLGIEALQSLGIPLDSAPAMIAQVMQLSRQGLAGSDEANTVLGIINDATEAWHEGSGPDRLAQKWLGVLEGAKPEEKAKTLGERLLQKLSGDKTLTWADAKSPAPAKTASFLAKMDNGLQGDGTLNALLNNTGPNMEGLPPANGNMLELASRMPEIEQMEVVLARARDTLRAFGQNVNPNDPQVQAACKLIHEAMSLARLRGGQEAIMKDVLDDLRKLGGFDPLRLSHTKDGWANVDLKLIRRMANDPVLVGAVEAVLTLNPEIVSRHAARRSDMQAAMTTLASRRARIGEAASTALRDAVRAAALMQMGDALFKFKPADHAASVKNTLAGWGINVAQFAPEIDFYLGQPFELEDLGRWADAADVQHKPAPPTDAEILGERLLQKLSGEPSLKWGDLKDPAKAAILPATMKSGLDGGTLKALREHVRPGNRPPQAQDNMLELASLLPNVLQTQVVMGQARKTLRDFGRMVNPESSDVQAACERILQAITLSSQTEEPDALLHAVEELRQLGDFDPLGLLNPRGNWANVDLKFIRRMAGDPKLVGAVKAVLALSPQAVSLHTTRQQAMQEVMDVLASRREWIGEKESTALRDAIRAAVLMQMGSIPPDQFKPSDHAVAIRRTLQDWGIAIDHFGPEIDFHVGQPFNPEDLGRWADAAEVKIHPSPAEDVREALMRALDKLPLTTRYKLLEGDRLEGQSGAIPLDPTLQATATARLAASRLTGLEIARQAEGFELTFRQGYEGRAGLDLAYKLQYWRAEATKFEVMGTGEGWKQRTEGVRLHFPNTEDGRAAMKKVMGLLLDGTPIDAGQLESVGSILPLKDRRKGFKFGAGLRAGIDVGHSKWGWDHADKVSATANARAMAQYSRQYTTVNAANSVGEIRKTELEIVKEGVVTAAIGLRAGMSGSAADSYGVTSSLVEAGASFGWVNKFKTKLVLGPDGLPRGMTERLAQAYVGGSNALEAARELGGPAYVQMMKDLEKNDKAMFAAMEEMITHIGVNELMNIVSRIHPAMLTLVARKLGMSTALLKGRAGAGSDADAMGASGQYAQEAQEVLDNDINYILHRMNVLPTTERQQAIIKLNAVVAQWSSFSEEKGEYVAQEVRMDVKKTTQLRDEMLGWTPEAQASAVAAKKPLGH